MADQQIIANIKSGLSVNEPKEKIIQTLKIQGYSDPEIDAAFMALNTENPTSQPQSNPQPAAVEIPAAQPSPVPQTPTPTTMPAASPTQSVSAEQTSAGPSNLPTVETSGSSGLKIALATGFIFVLLGAGAAYAYFNNIGPFVIEQYTNDNLLSGVLEKSKQIKSGSYKLSGSLVVNPRDKDAVPFVLNDQDPNFETKYKKDRDSISYISSLVSSLNYTSLSNGFGDMPVIPNSASLSNRVYPKTKTDIEKATKNSSMYYFSKAPDYTYTQTENTHNFNIVLTLETDEAVKQIKKSRYYSATSTLVSGKQVTFTKDSRYISIPYQVPKPLLMTFADNLRLISPDVSGSVEIGAAANFKDASSTDWKANVNGGGTFGDLTYSVDVDALHKSLDYYFRINKMPGIFSFISAYKGQWIKISPATSTATSTTSSYSIASVYTSSFTKQEAAYKEKRERFAKELRDIVALAQDEKVVLIKGNPQKENIDGRNLVRYDLDIQKNAILPFYEKLIAQSDSLKDIPMVEDKEFLTYLQGDEFSRTFDYFKSNTSITLWVDKEGYPAIIQYGMRIVPPDTASQLKDKQINIVLKLTLGNINEDIKINAPEDAKTIEEIEKEIKNNQ